MENQKDVVSKSKKRRERKKKCQATSSSKEKNCEENVNVVVNEESEQIDTLTANADPVTKIVKDSCPVCGEEENLMKCMGCLYVAYCQPEHQKQHWKIHKNDCCPFKITVDPVMGKQMVATRNLKAGTLVLEEFPVLCYPSFNGLKFVCLSCGLDFKGEQPRLCSTCQWPVCSPECEQMLMHKENECFVFARQKIEFPVSSYIKSWFLRKYHLRMDNESSLMVICIELIRGLRLKILNPKMYEDLLNENYNANRDNSTGFYNLFGQAIGVLRQLVDVRDLLLGNDVSEGELLRLIKTIRDNNFGNCRIMGKERDNIHGTFLRASRLNHSCCPNSEEILIPSRGFSINIRTLTPVTKGEPLTLNYFDDDLIRQWRATRQKRIRKEWGFLCRCLRCRDPTEFGTYLDGVCCLKCHPTDETTGERLRKDKDVGFLIPVNPLDFENDAAIWKCNACEATKPLKDILELLRKVKKELDEIIQLDTTETDQLSRLNKFLEKNLKVVHQNHFMLRYAVAKMINLLDPVELFDRGGFNVAYMHWQYMITTNSILAPGISGVRAQNLFALSNLILSVVNNIPDAFSDKEKIDLHTQAISCCAQSAVRYDVFDNNQAKVAIVQLMIDQMRNIVTELELKQINLNDPVPEVKFG